MPTNNRNINPVGWTDDPRRLPHRRTAAYGEIYPAIVPLGFVPPFQLVRASDAGNIDSIILFKVSDSSETDITALMESTGFVVKNFGDYKIWEYPATVALPGTFEEGRYSMIIRDNEDKFLYREIFSWKNSAGMANFVKLEWFHLEKIELPFGHIEFKAPFKFWHYFQTEMGKPEYPVNREVEERDGYEFTLKVTSWREDKFVTVGNQFLADAVSLIHNMDCVFAYFLGEMFEINRAIISTEWVERGHLAKIEFELRSGTIVTTTGETREPKNYVPMAGECLAADFIAVARVSDNSPEHLGHYYINNDGIQVDFIPGENVLVKSVTDGKARLYLYFGGGYTPEIIPNQREIVYDKNLNQYLFYTGFYKFSEPIIIQLNESPFSIKGFTYKNSLIEVWGKDLAGNEELLAVGSDEEFEGSGISFEEGDNTTFFVKASTHICKHISSSEAVTIDGIGVMVIGSTFIVGSDSNTPQPQYPVDDF